MIMIEKLEECPECGEDNPEYWDYNFQRCSKCDEKKSIENQSLHPEFIKYAETFGINLDHEEDYIDWWICWKSGYDIKQKEVNEIIKDFKIKHKNLTI